MDSLEAFTVLAEHADTQHTYIVGKIGQEAIAASNDMSDLSTNALLSLDDHEFRDYITTPTDGETTASFDDPYLDATMEFSEKVDELFGDIDGYRLFSADEHAVVIHKMLHTHSDSAVAIVRLSVTALGEELTIRKVKQIVGGIHSGTEELPIGPYDETTAERVLERLAYVNQSLQAQ